MYSRYDYSESKIGLVINSECFFFFTEMNDNPLRAIVSRVLSTH